MNIHHVISILGILVGFFGLLVFYLSSQYAYLTVVSLVVIGFIYYFWDSFLQADCKIIYRKNTIIIEDKNGTKARSKMTKKIRANHSGLVRYVHRNLSASGTIKNFGTNFGTLRVIKQAGDYIVYHSFPHPLKKWKTAEFDLTSEYENCFLEHQECVIVLVDAKIKYAKTKIILPEGRPCLNAKVIHRHGIKEKELTPPTISNNNREIVWEKKRLRKIGSEYEIQWTW